MTALAGGKEVGQIRAGRSRGEAARGRSARRAARRVWCRGVMPALTVGCRPAVTVLGADAMVVKGGLHLAAGGPGLAARALGQLGHPLSHFSLGRLDDPGRLRLDGTRRLLHGRAVLRLARELDQLLVALPARSGPQHEANSKADDEHESVPHPGTPLPRVNLRGRLPPDRWAYS